jgi:hypothetical protein
LRTARLAPGGGPGLVIDGELQAQVLVGVKRPAAAQTPDERAQATRPGARTGLRHVFGVTDGPGPRHVPSATEQHQLIAVEIHTASFS